MKKTIEYLGFALVIVLMLAAVLTYLAPHLGWRVDAVASGSMEPYFKVGSLVVTRPVSPEAIKVGDIITFEPATIGGTVITYRVTGIDRGSLFYFITKGDANGCSDAISVPARNVVGKVCFHLPYAGYVTEFLKTPWGYLLGRVIPAIIIIAMYVRSIRQTLSKGKTDKVKSG